MQSSHADGLYAMPRSVSECAENGLLVKANGKGRLQNNKFTGNRAAGVRVEAGADPDMYALGRG